MLSFECDYNNGAHPQVMQHLMDTNHEQTLTYGFDIYSERAKEKIKKVCQKDDAEVFFLVGGTQTNATVIDGMLRSYEAVITVSSGHISIHEAGAIEASGHKVIALQSHDGKLNADDLRHYMEWFHGDESRDHLAQPGMVYISFPTEYGTLYSANEIDSIYQLCRQHGLHLFIDGARLGYGLAASADVTLPWLCRHCDALYIGGTKVGALCGEAVVFTHGNTPRCFFSIIKRHGALLAKGRLTGVQFDALFSPLSSHNAPPYPQREAGDEASSLYMSISHHAIIMARKLKNIFLEKGYEFWIDSPTNQQFVVLPNDEVSRLEEKVLFTHWEPVGTDRMVCRFVTSWATTDNDLLQLRRLL